MIEKNIVTEDLKNQIQAHASVIIDSIKDEITSLRDQEIDLYKASLQKEIDAYTEKELNDLKLLSATQISQSKLKIKRDLLLVRTELVEQLFNEVKNELIKFRNGKEYSSYLKNKCESIAKNQNLSDGKIEAREKDIPLLEAIMQQHNWSVELVSGDIEFGGIRYVNESKGIELDETLDASLKNQEVWFQNNSGFTL